MKINKLAAILCLVALGITGCASNTPKETADLSNTSNVAVENIDTNTAETVETTQSEFTTDQVTTDNQAVADTSDWKQRYETVLNDLSNEKIVEYITYDIDKSGAPELVVKHGEDEENLSLSVYSYDGVDVKHSVICIGSCDIVQNVDDADTIYLSSTNCCGSSYCKIESAENGLFKKSSSCETCETCDMADENCDDCPMFEPMQTFNISDLSGLDRAI